MEKLKELIRPLGRSVIALLLALGVSAAVGQVSKEELHLTVTMVTGEHSRDSNSTTTTLTVERDTLVYEQSQHGAHSASRKPLKREYKLTSEDQAALIKVLQEKNLLGSKTVSALPLEQRPQSYFSLVIRTRLNRLQGLGENEHSTTITGPRNGAKLKENQTYRDSIYLIEQLYKIINRTEADVSMPQLLN